MARPDILHERSGVVAVLKPVGLATQAAAGIPSVEAWLRDRLGGGASRYVGVPHRLDRAVSGVVLLAATPRAARKLSRQFERREIVKTYLAVVEAADGRPVEACGGEWRDQLRKVAGEPRGEVVGGHDPDAREAVTRVRLLRRDDGGRDALLALEPLTGRMHQLRIQAATRGLPIVGDELYGGRPVTDGDVRERPILLHARSIAFADPDTGDRIVVDAPVPAHWPGWAIPE